MSNTNNTMLNKVNGITIIEFLRLTKNIEDCDKTRPDLKKQLIDLKVKAKEVLRKFENGEDQPENSISSAFDKIQQYKKYF